MLQTKYYKDLHHNYLIAGCPVAAEGEHYQLRMVTDNQIAGLLPVSKRHINGEALLYYRVNSLQVLRTMFEQRKMDRAAVVRLLGGLSRALRELQNYLLGDAGLVLAPEHIYLNWESEEVFFLYYPYEGEIEVNQMRILFEYLVRVIDHRDPELTDVVYGLCQLAENEAFTGEALERGLERLVGASPDDSDGLYTGRACPAPTSGDGDIQERERGNVNRRGGAALREAPRPPSRVEGAAMNPVGAVESAPAVRYRPQIGDESSAPGYPPDPRKQLRKFIILTIVSAAGAGFTFFYQRTLPLSPHETLLSWILLVVFLVFFLMAGGVCLVLGKGGGKTNPNAGAGVMNHAPTTNTSVMPLHNGEMYSVGAQFIAPAPLPSPDDFYGDTIFLADHEEGRENKLYGTGRASKHIIDLNHFPFTVGKLAAGSDYCLT
ncbi:MAG: DUF6382 domain-containing protein, partial [Lachnospiraceae bacterium]|nr:DUF6382 domain-containing protein [Lachnospiraceae bacterium]